MSAISAYNGQYINYSLIHDYNFILNFFSNHKVYSNIRNYKVVTNKLLNYEKKRNYSKDNTRQKVYAIQLIVMLPLNLKKQDKHEIIKNFMLNISLKYKDIMYLYTFSKKGKGSYADIIIFERQFYKKKHIIYPTYKRDMYINKQTGRTSNKYDKNAILLCKKGDRKKDNKGNQVKEEIEVSPKKYRFLNFKSNHDMIKKNERFKNFKDKLTKKLVAAITKVVANTGKSYKLRICSWNKVERISEKIIYYNSMINRLNIELGLIQRYFKMEKALYEPGEAKIAFNHLFFSLITYLNNGYIDINKKSGMRLIIDPKSKISYSKYKENIDYFEKYISKRILKWYFDQFYDPTFDQFYDETNHPFRLMKNDAFYIA